MSIRSASGFEHITRGGSRHRTPQWSLVSTRIFFDPGFCSFALVVRLMRRTP